MVYISGASKAVMLSEAAQEVGMRTSHASGKTGLKCPRFPERSDRDSVNFCWCWNQICSFTSENPSMINDCQQSCNSRGTLCATFLVLLGVVITKVWHQTRVDPCYFCSGILLQQGLNGRLSVLSAFRICFSATGADEKEGPVSAHQRSDSTTWGQFFWLTLFFRFHRWSPSQQPLSLLNYYKSWTPDSQYGGVFFFLKVLQLK